MLVAAHSMATPDLSPERAIVMYGSIGFDAIELICDDEFRCGVPLSTTPPTLQNLRSHARNVGLSIVGITPYIKEIDEVDDSIRRVARDALRRCILIANELQASVVRVWAGQLEPHESGALNARKRIVDLLQSIADEATDAGCSLVVENHPGSLAPNAKETLEIIRLVDHPAVGVLYDPSNTLVLGEKDWKAALDAQRQFIRHVHVKDLRVFPSGESAPVLMGEGDVPWKQIISDLRSGGYDSALSVEYVKRWHKDILPEPAIALRHELRAIREMWMGDDK